MKKTHWFFINSKLLEIYTYGSGDHPTVTYTFEEKEEFSAMINRLIAEGYEFSRDQAQ